MNLARYGISRNCANCLYFLLLSKDTKRVMQLVVLSEKVCVVAPCLAWKLPDLL